MSFLGALFGRRGSAATAKVSDPVEYKGFVIRAAPFKSYGNYQTAGTIEREFDGVRKTYVSSAPTPTAPMRKRGELHLEQGAADHRSAGRADFRLEFSIRASVRRD